jgi:hypothetical protein
MISAAADVQARCSSQEMRCNQAEFYDLAGSSTGHSAGDPQAGRISSIAAVV